MAVIKLNEKYRDTCLAGCWSLNTKCLPLLKVSFLVLTRSTGGYLAASALDVLHFKFLLTLPLLSHGTESQKLGQKLPQTRWAAPVLPLRSATELMSRLKQGYLAIMQHVFSAGYFWRKSYSSMLETTSWLVHTQHEHLALDALLSGSQDTSNYVKCWTGIHLASRVGRWKWLLCSTYLHTAQQKNWSWFWVAF